jgi:hypothetical protein
LRAAAQAKGFRYVARHREPEQREGAAIQE